jgi:hypothetical protein
MKQGHFQLPTTINQVCKRNHNNKNDQDSQFDICADFAFNDCTLESLDKQKYLK